MDSKRPGIYVRISSDPQGLRAGVERQEADCRDLAERRGWGVAEIYSDNDISAFSGKARPAYKRMLADIESGTIDGVIVWALDRLHRSPKELEHFIDLADSHHVALASVTGDVDLSTSDGRFTARTLGNVARKASEDSSRRLQRKMESLAQEGKFKGGKRPFGFEPDGTTLRSEEASLIRAAAKRILAGESLRCICAEWNGFQQDQQCIIARTARTAESVAGRKWDPQALKRILTSPRIAGLREHKGEVVGEAQWDAIVERATWERLRGLLNDPSRSQSRARSYLLTGFAFCSLCGGKMIARPRTDGQRAYVCGPDTGGCNKISIKAEPLEEMVSDILLTKHDSPTIAKALRAAAGADDAQRGLIESLEADESALDHLAVEYFSNRILGRSEYLAAKGALESRIGATRKALQRNTGAGVLASIDNGVRDAWESRGFDWQRSLIGAVLERVTVLPARRGLPRFDPERVQLTWRA